MHAAIVGRCAGSTCQDEVMSGPRSAKPFGSRSCGRLPDRAACATCVASVPIKGGSRCASSHKSSANE